MRDAFKPALREAHASVMEKKRRATPEPLRPLPGHGTPPPAPEGQDAYAPGDGELPPFLSASYIRPASIVTPPILVENLLHRGCKMVLAGGSKSFKSWSLVDLGLSLASGAAWWGMRCQQGVVVYVNFELIQGFLEWRIHHICQARGFKLPEWFLYWNLRHKCYDLATVGRVLRARIEALKIRVDLIIVDPIYKALGGMDENSASDMAALMESIENLSEETGAAVVFGAHFSKGNQASKEPKDRISGSGVFGRDPDAILTMTRHQEEHCYIVESDLRYVPPLPDFVLQWKFPVMTVNEGLDPSAFYVPPTMDKKAKPKDEKPEPGLTDDQVFDALSHAGWQDAAWKFAVRARYGKAGPEYFAAKKRLLEQGRVVKQGLKYLPSSFALAQD